MSRRMFSTQIVGSDAFLEMPTSSRELYFQLGMAADDDGFVNPQRIIRMIGAQGDDLKVLVGKRFLLPFKSGVVVVKHWLIHNLIRADLYKETLYTEEKKTLGLNDNGAYTELRNGIAELNRVEAPKWLRIRRKELRTANVPKTALRLGKVRLGKDRLVNTMSAVADLSFDEFWEQYPKKELKKKSKEIWKRKELSSKLVVILEFIKLATATERWQKGFIKAPTTFLNGECWNDDLKSYGEIKKGGLAITKY